MLFPVTRAATALLHCGRGEASHCILLPSAGLDKTQAVRVMSIPKTAGAEGMDENWEGGVVQDLHEQ